MLQKSTVKGIFKYETAENIMPQIQMWDICVDCTEEFVSNEVIRVVLPTGKLEREPFYY